MKLFKTIRHEGQGLIELDVNNAPKDLLSGNYDIFYSEKNRDTVERNAVTVLKAQHYRGRRDGIKLVLETSSTKKLLFVNIYNPILGDKQETIDFLKQAKDKWKNALDVYSLYDWRGNPNKNIVHKELEVEVKTEGRTGYVIITPILEEEL